MVLAGSRWRFRLPDVLLYLDDLLQGHVKLGGQFVQGRLAAQVPPHLPLHPGQLVDHLDHLHRDAPQGGGWSARARVIACRIHQVAYVENL